MINFANQQTNDSDQEIKEIEISQDEMDLYREQNFDKIIIDNQYNLLYQYVYMINCFQNGFQSKDSDWMISQAQIEEKTQKLKTEILNNYFPVPLKIDDDNSIFVEAECGSIPNLENHQPDEQDENGFTIAMILAINNIEIPKEWKHNSDIQNKYGCTVAMYQAKNKNIPDQCWNHDPLIKNIDNYTVALILTSNGIIPPQEWQHDKIIRARQYNANIKYYRYYTVQNFLKQHNIEVPEQWQYNNIVNSNDDTQAMIEVRERRIPQQQLHDPNIQNIQGKTVAMLITFCCNQVPPQQWNHNPEIRDENGYTTAMIMAKWQYYVPPIQWQHDSSLQNLNGYTVAMYLAQNGITPPDQWYHDLNLENNFGETVVYLLNKHNVEIPQKWKDKKYK